MNLNVVYFYEINNYVQSLKNITIQICVMLLFYVYYLIRNNAEEQRCKLKSNVRKVGKIYHCARIWCCIWC